MTEDGREALHPPATTTTLMTEPVAFQCSDSTDVPVYGSFAYHVLPESDPRRQVAKVLHEAACWRKFAECEYLVELLDEWLLWDRRRAEGEASTAVSKYATDYGIRPGPTFKQIEARRRLTSVHPCGRCGQPVELVHPFLDENWNVPPIRCPRCTGLEAGAG